MRTIRRILVIVIIFIVVLVIGGGAVGAASYLQNNSGVITTNFPQTGGTVAALQVRLYPPIGYGDYSNMVTDPAAISANTRDAVLANARKQLPAGLDVITLNNWSDAREGLNAVQIVNNVPIGGTAYTIILPAHWSKTGKVPILLSGNGAGVSNNQRLWSQGDVSLIHLVGLASQSGRTGLIGAYSNAGGTESQGIDDHMYQSVDEFFKFIGQNGGDPQHAITAGGSRGGGTALMWAINPKQYADYNVQAVFADIPPTAYGLLSQQSVLTYPDLGYIYVSVTHDTSAYLYSDPNGPTKPALHYLIGVDDPTQADAISPIGLADRLKGKVVVIARGTHDVFFPLREFLAFDRKLTALGIDHTTDVTLGQGHVGNSFLAKQIESYIDQLSQGQTYQPPLGRFLFIDLNPPDGLQVPLAEFIKNGLTADPNATPASGGDLPFAAEIPHAAGVGNPVDISVCGKIGAAYSYSAKASDGTLWAQGSGTLDASECAYQRINAPDKPGDYTWAFTYQNQPISAANTPVRDAHDCGIPAVTHVLAIQPSPDKINANSDGNNTQSLGFGVDQYSAQFPGCSSIVQTTP